MRTAISKHEELQNELVNALQQVNEQTSDPVDLYGSLRRLEDRFKSSGLLVPEILEGLEREFEREFCATSQGRD